MTDPTLVKKIQVLKQIKPRKDWVILTKSQILRQEPSLIEQFSSSLEAYFQYKPAFATLIALMVLIGSFGFAQNSLPGDALYPLKKIVERGQAIFVSKKELPSYNLEIANKRLEELTKIAQTNQVRKLAPAISEFQANVSQAAENLGKTREPDVKEIVVETKKLEKNKEKIEALGVVIGETKELDNALAQLVEREIKDLEKRTLSESQEKIVVQIREDFELGNYNQALEKILLLSNQ